MTAPNDSFTNRLIHETSPYLRQHAHNPVDWYSWSDEALTAARRLDRPIFLSIGYSACHWCHVMEHESFVDLDIAGILNQHFVSIKVDREERPDLDQIYMTAVQLITGQGGWPMSMFLTPELKPFYGGTYFPPDDRYGRPSFKKILLSIVDAWKNKRDELLQSSSQITEHLNNSDKLVKGNGDLTPELIRQAAQAVGRGFDSRYGGFGAAPKFPHAVELRLLLHSWKRWDDDNSLHMVRLTLDKMAAGGIYDHLGGGFHRYSTDERWLAPHFEKMLYDNALLTLAYVEAFGATQDPFYREIAEETLDYVKREMTSPEGAFFSTQDADTEGVEGKFFVWSLAELETILGKDTADLFGEAYDLSAEGNWEGHNILHRERTDEQLARLRGMPQPDIRRLLKDAKKKLFEVRGRRVWPGRDEKILTAWNGLMINAFAQAAQVLDRPDYAEIAARAADFILDHMRDPSGRFYRTTGAGALPKLNAYLEDYSFVIDALITLYESTFQIRWILAALQLTQVMIDEFWDDAQGGFFFTGRNHEALISRTKDPHDSSIPSGNALAVLAMLRLAKLTGHAELWDKAEKTLLLFQGLMESAPMAASQMLIALDFYLGPVQEFAVVGDPSAADTAKAIQVIRQGFRPNKVMAFRSAITPDKQAEDVLPLLAGKTASGEVTTYICQNFTCQNPLTGVPALVAALRSV